MQENNIKSILFCDKNVIFYEEIEEKYIFVQYSQFPSVQHRYDTKALKNPYFIRGTVSIQEAAESGKF